MNMLQCAIHPKEYSRISMCKSAKEMWIKLELLYESTSQVRETKANMCNKSRHMNAECLEAKKDKYKNHKVEFHKKKNKAMVATWSDEDQSSDNNEESSSSEGNEICFMAGSSEEQGIGAAWRVDLTLASERVTTNERIGDKG
ncbi:hypothetical protein Taro_035321 [Colocasia esculenta]|uniref:Uncharacterized protein n=1 Tax=Colocasia esculenta TaxID=4460 RepID=A0A843VYQ7_COLES|nr:hypothetical protein [Colocasia esculenta]